MKSKLNKIILLVCGAMLISACSGGSGQESGVKYCTVKYDVNTNMITSQPEDQKIAVGKRARKPSVFVRQENPENLQIQGWYTTKDFTKEWDFKHDTVQNDMTLYANWKVQCKVTFNIGYPGHIEENIYSTKVFAGDHLKEDRSYALGYTYMGSYLDRDFTQRFDYENSVIEKDTEIFILRSQYIFLSDDQNLTGGSGTLFDNLEPLLGSPDEEAELGYVDTCMVGDDVCTRVNFGYTPNKGDGFVEFNLNLDISHSQKLCFEMKNLGPSETLKVYYVAMNDLENSIYSETGASYTEKYSKVVRFDGDFRNMSEDAPWRTIELDLSSEFKNGYSVWGTSSFLGKLRIESTYKSNPNKKDFSNEFLIKSIYGVYEDVVTKDSDEISAIWNAPIDKTRIQEISNAQKQTEGFVFPKNFTSVATPGDFDNAEVKISEEGLLFHTDNQLNIKKTVDEINKKAGEIICSTTSIITMEVGDSRDVIIENDDQSIVQTTLNITLKNLGYASALTLFVENEYGSVCTSNITLNPRMNTFKTYSLNLFNKSGMNGKLKSISLSYNAVGVDNLLVISDVSLSAFTRQDIVGLNFYDLDCLGFSSSNSVNVMFDKYSFATEFEVPVSTSDKLISKNSFDTTIQGYKGINLRYILPVGSNITDVILGFNIGGEWQDIEINLDRSVLSWSTIETYCDLPGNFETGQFSAIRIGFVGTGIVELVRAEFVLSDYSLPYSSSYDGQYDKSWIHNCSYFYDTSCSASVFNRTDDLLVPQFSMYIAHCSRYYASPHRIRNIPLYGMSKLILIYHNETDKGAIGFDIGLDADEEMGIYDGTSYPRYVIDQQSLRSNMAQYSWDTLTIDISNIANTNPELFIAKIVLNMNVSSIYIRGVVVE